MLEQLEIETKQKLRGIMERLGQPVDEPAELREAGEKVASGLFAGQDSS